MASVYGQLGPSDVQQWAECHSNLTVRQNAARLFELSITSSSLLRDGIADDLVAEGFSKIAAKDIVACFKKDAHTDAIVFWDIENLPIPKDLSALQTVERIKFGLRSYGFMKSSFQVYGGHHVVHTSKRSDLTQSSCSFIDTPHDGNKETADKLLIANILLWAMDNPPPAKIVLMCGDGDISYVISRLVSRGYMVVLVHNQQAKERLKVAASFAISWELLTRERDAEDEEIEDAEAMDLVDAAHLAQGPVKSPAKMIPQTASASGTRAASAAPPAAMIRGASSHPAGHGAARSSSGGSAAGRFVIDAEDNVSVEGSEEQQRELLESGLKELVDMLHTMDNGKPARHHAGTTVASRLKDQYPTLKQQLQKRGATTKLFDLAEKKGMIDVDRRMQPSQPQNYLYWLKLTVDKA